MSSQNSCLCCGGDVKVLVDFGPQTPSNRFELPEFPVTDRHPLMVGQCGDCALIQLIKPMAPAMAKSRFEWLTYNEPEGHLDDLVARLRRIPGLESGSRIVGLTYKDDSTLARFNRLGYANTYRYEPAADFGLTDPCASLESIQGALDAATASRLAAHHGLADVLLVRHVLEHAHDPVAFLRAVATLVKPGGYLLFEMPDSEKFIRACDYSFVWEEHITYLCAPTLSALIGHAQLDLSDTIVYPYPLEDSLIGIVRNAQGDAPSQRADEAQLAGGAEFARRYPEARARLKSLLENWRRSGKKAAIFGAGHLAAKFVNMYGLKELIDCVIDDNPNKRALLMPGSRLAIRGSADLDARAIDFCLLSLSPESEQKVRAKNQPFLDRGGKFFSIFALSPGSVYAANS